MLAERQLVRGIRVLAGLSRGSSVHQLLGATLELLVVSTGDLRARVQGVRALQDCYWATGSDGDQLRGHKVALRYQCALRFGLQTTVERIGRSPGNVTDQLAEDCLLPWLLNVIDFQVATQYQVRLKARTFRAAAGCDKPEASSSRGRPAHRVDLECGAHTPMIAPCAREAAPLCAALQNPLIHHRWAVGVIKALGALPENATPAMAKREVAPPHRLLALERDILALPLLRLIAFALNGTTVDPDANTVFKELVATDIHSGCPLLSACLRLLSISDAAAGVLYHYVSWLSSQDATLQSDADLRVVGGVEVLHGTLLTRVVPLVQVRLRGALTALQHLRLPGALTHSRLALAVAPTWRSLVINACSTQVHPVHAMAAFVRDTSVDTSGRLDLSQPLLNNTWGVGKWWATPSPDVSTTLQADELEFLTVSGASGQARRRCYAVRTLILLLQQPQGGPVQRRLPLPAAARLWLAQQHRDASVGTDQPEHLDGEDAAGASPPDQVLAVALGRLGALVSA